MLPRKTHCFISRLDYVQFIIFFTEYVPYTPLYTTILVLLGKTNFFQGVVRGFPPLGILQQKRIIYSKIHYKRCCACSGLKLTSIHNSTFPRRLRLRPSLYLIPFARHSAIKVLQVAYQCYPSIINVTPLYWYMFQIFQNF